MQDDTGALFPAQFSVPSNSPLTWGTDEDLPQFPEGPYATPIGKGQTATVSPPAQGTTSAAVDPTLILCDEIDNLTVVFGSTNNNGFKLPENLDCDCSVDISFDYMLKYNAADLKECAVYTCTPAIFNEVTLDFLMGATYIGIDNLNSGGSLETGTFSWYGYNCRNFIAFVDTDTEQTDLLNNFGNNTNFEFDVWTQTVTQLEPDPECCQSMGGVVVPYSQWGTFNDQWTSTVFNTYVASYTNQTWFSPYVIEMADLWEQIRNIYSYSDCIDLPDFDPSYSM